MFDDPKKSLRKMEEALWAAEEPEETSEAPDLEEALEFADEDWLNETKALLEPKEDQEEETEEEDAEEETAEASMPPLKKRFRRNTAQDFHRTVFADETVEENAAVFVEKKKKGVPLSQIKRPLGCLPLIILLELIGIALLCWWWIRWLR